ncbi:hypothetical protein BGZ73_001200 [Actinomortierella ambigua]|nr:hypothetical protein BGZ73_001200 [Actinomortierella ambigua]
MNSVTPGPTDAISGLAFSPQADLLAASSWDNNVRIYEIQANGTSVAKSMYSHDAPALSVAWSRDGTKIASGGADKQAKMFDITTGQSQVVAQHDAPIKEVRWVDGPILATGSWDKTIKYWDLRQQTPVTTVALPERLYTMDAVGMLMVAGTAERHILIYNLNNPSQPFKTMQSPLKWQTRTISCFPNATGYAVGSIEGRVAIQYVEDKDQGGNFSFRCHREGGTTQRDKATIYPVNSIQWNPVFGTFSTAGGDGGIVFWDKDAKQKLKVFDKVNQPIAASCFNSKGNIFAYGVGYDWHKGHSGAQQGTQNKIMLKSVNEADIKPRQKR